MTTASSDWVGEHEARKNWVNKLFYGDNLDVLRDRIASTAADYSVYVRSGSRDMISGLEVGLTGQHSSLVTSRIRPIHK